MDYSQKISIWHPVNPGHTAKRTYNKGNEWLLSEAKALMERKDYEKAIKNYKILANELNNKIAQFILGKIYINGLDTIECNYDLGKNYLLMASGQGYTPAQQLLDFKEQQRLSAPHFVHNQHAPAAPLRFQPEQIHQRTPEDLQLNYATEHQNRQTVSNVNNNQPHLQQMRNNANNTNNQNLQFNFPLELQLGIESGNYQKDFPKPPSLVDAPNDPVAQCARGIAHKYGLGVSQDNLIAAEFFRRAAIQNNANGQYELGMMYLEGLGVLQDEAEARNQFHLAAKQKHIPAQAMLDQMSQVGSPQLEQSRSDDRDYIYQFMEDTLSGKFPAYETQKRKAFTELDTDNKRRKVETSQTTG